MSGKLGGGMRDPRRVKKMADRGKFDNLAS